MLIMKGKSEHEIQVRVLREAGRHPHAVESREGLEFHH